MNPASLRILRILAARRGDVGEMARLVLDLEGERVEDPPSSGRLPAMSPDAIRMRNKRAEQRANKTPNTGEQVTEQEANSSPETPNAFAPVRPDVRPAFAPESRPALAHVDQDLSSLSLENSNKNSNSQPVRSDAGADGESDERSSAHDAPNTRIRVRDTATASARRDRTDRDMAAKAAAETERLAAWAAGEGGKGT